MQLDSEGHKYLSPYSIISFTIIVSKPSFAAFWEPFNDEASFKLAQMYLDTDRAHVRNLLLKVLAVAV